MKKVLAITVLTLILLALVCTPVKATTQSELEEYLLASHEVSAGTVSLTEADKVKVQRYFAEHTLTDDQATAVKAKADEIIAIFDKAGVTDAQDLSSSDKAAVLAAAQEAGAEVGLTITYNSTDEVLEIYENGELIETSSTELKLVQTGSNNVLAISLAVVAIIAIAAIVVVKKVKTANA